MMAVTRVVVVAMLRAAVVAHGAPACDGAAPAVAADDDTLAIDARAAGAAGVGKAAVIRTVVARLCVRRGHHSKAGDNGQKSEYLFYGLVFCWFFSAATTR